ncbi:MAG: hypothetical protein ACE37H_09040 [Phycisphaeraceae bacterium]
MKRPRPLSLLIALVFAAALPGCASGTAPDLTLSSTRLKADRPATRIDTNALWQQYRASDHAQALRAMLDNHAISVDGDTMPLHVELIWDEDRPRPDAGYPVYISLHGGGAFTEIENHEQWEKQFTRYPGVRGLYVCPHSPMDTWDQWHHERVLRLIDTLVKAIMLRDDIDPNRVYLNGYCSGGNGVYQLAPILADRFAACSATKAIGEGAPLENLRNLPIDLQWGEHDHETLDRPGFNRASVDKLLAMRRDDPEGYDFRDVEHWRQGRVVNDKSTMRWMSRYTRNPYPDRVVWHQDGDVRASSNPPRHHMYWLGVDEAYALDGTPDHADARIERDTNTLRIDARGYDRLHVYLNDQMLDLDQPVRVILNGQVVVNRVVERSADVTADVFAMRGDPASVYTAKLTLEP